MRFCAFQGRRGRGGEGRSGDPFYDPTPPSPVLFWVLLSPSPCSIPSTSPFSVASFSFCVYIYFFLFVRWLVSLFHSFARNLSIPPLVHLSLAPSLSLQCWLTDDHRSVGCCDLNEPEEVCCPLRSGTPSGLWGDRRYSDSIPPSLFCLLCNSHPKSVLRRGTGPLSMTLDIRERLLRCWMSPGP